MSTIGRCPPRELLALLNSSGLKLGLGSLSLAVRSDSPALAAQLQATYPHFPLVPAGGFTDVHAALVRAKGLRRWIRPQVWLVSDGLRQFHPFPADTALPLLEWGVNWLIAERLNDLLLLHAGALERDGMALLLPATPGSGKSTLTAALAHRGWRLLSDEFGAVDPRSREIGAILKPIALKNQSIDVIRRFAPEAVLGPEFPKTRKGTVCHVAAPEDAVRRVAQRARPALVVLPKWAAASPTKLERLPAIDVFRALAFNSFNYDVLGRTGFEAAAAMARECEGWSLEYSDLDDAVARIDELWSRVTRQQADPVAPAPAAIAVPD